MFVFAIRYYLLEGKGETFNFIETDIKKKIESLGKEEGLWKTALLCSFMGMFDIMPIEVSRASLPSRKIMLDCNIYEECLEYLSSSDKAFLFKQEEGGGYRIRHDLWALEFLIYVYSEKFNDHINELFRKYKYEIGQLIKIKQLIKDGIKQILPCILNNIEINDHLSILNRCSSLYVEYERSKSLCDMIIDNYVIPDKMKSQEYYSTLANLHFYRKDYINSLQFYDKAIEIVDLVFL
jgi:tetratricopeptide (TPR) repeat protein